MEYIVEVSNVTKSYGDVVAVSDVSFQIPTGAIMGFLGPNGSGKTTSIKMLLGLTKPQTGTVTVSGQNPFLNRLIKYDIGYKSEIHCFLSNGLSENYVNFFKLAKDLGITIRKLSTNRIRFEDMFLDAIHQGDSE